MITIRRSNERGHADHGWLDTYHTFSFGQYHDPDHMGFRSLRVMNEDRVESGKGFGTHGHDNMEIITYVVSGAVEHRDSMGNGSVIPAGAFQRITAGTGITHSEFNPSEEEGLHFYQIWIEPDQRDLEPSYQEWHPAEEQPVNTFHPVAHPKGGGEAITIHQDATLSLATLEVGTELSHAIDPTRHAWVQVIAGAIRLSGHDMASGDGAAISNEADLVFVANEASQVLLFDLA